MNEWEFLNGCKYRGVDWANVKVGLSALKKENQDRKESHIETTLRAARKYLRGKEKYDRENHYLSWVFPYMGHNVDRIRWWACEAAYAMDYLYGITPKRIDPYQKFQDELDCLLDEILRIRHIKTEKLEMNIYIDYVRNKPYRINIYCTYPDSSDVVEIVKNEHITISYFQIRDSRGYTERTLNQDTLEPWKNTIALFRSIKKSAIESRGHL